MDPNNEEQTELLRNILETLTEMNRKLREGLVPEPVYLVESPRERVKTSETP